MTAFFNFDQLDQIHIELTNACNAACPMCARFHNNSPLVRPDLELEQITIDQFKAWFPPEVLRKMHIILFCGTHGDPGMARDLYEICEYIADSHPNGCVRIHTNGGMRKPEWWAKLGDLVANQRQDHDRWQVIFSVDGLRDTNHIYRRNVDWDSLEANMRAYCAAGGHADWDYLIFKHNEHQIEEARALAAEIGIRNFIPKKALGVDNGRQTTKMPAMTREGTLEYFIEAPTLAKNRNLSIENPESATEVMWPFNPEVYKKLRETRDDGKDFKSRVASCYKRVDREDTAERRGAEILCKAKTMTGGIEVFIDNRGYVMPCCYIGTHLNGVHSDFKYLQLHHELDKYGWEKFSLKNKSLVDILAERHLDKVFTESWKKDSISHGKMAYCSDTCGMYSAVDKIYTHEGMEDKSRLWRKLPNPNNSNG